MGVLRAEALARLEQMFTTCAASRGQIALVQGPIASGKSWLLHRFAEQRSVHNATALTATAFPHDDPLAVDVVHQLLREARVRGVDAAPGPEPQEVDADAELAVELARLAQRGVVLVMVDDCQEADGASLTALLVAARRLRNQPIMLVLGARDSFRPDYIGFRSEVGRQPYFRRIWLDPISSEEIEALLPPGTGRVAGERIATAIYDYTQGNALLVNALIEDTCAATGPVGGLRVGPAFGEAVLNFLHRCDPVTRTVVQALAVLGQPHTSRFLAAVLDLDVSVVSHSLRALRAAGLITDSGFRHSPTRSTILDSLSSTERRNVHQRVAETLYREGAAAPVVATHLMAGDPAAADWSVAVLKEAARHQQLQSNPDTASKYLHAARDLTHDATERSALTASMALLEWRLDPVRAARLMPDLIASFRARRLSVQATTMVIRYLVWFGWLDEAQQVIGQIADLAPEAGPDDRAELTLLQAWLTYAHPSVLERVPHATDALAAELAPTTVAVSPELDSIRLIRSFQANQAGAEVVEGAEHLLSTCRVSDTTLEPLMISLVILISADRLAVAEEHCSRLLRQAEEHEAPAWRGELSHLDGAISLRMGDLATAVSQSLAALADIAPVAWGSKIGGPLATLLLAYTAMGRLQQAEAVAARPTPKTMFETGFGVYYLHARGRYYLKVGKYSAAHNDFEAYRSLIARWHLTIDGLVAWRLDQAELHLCQGHPQQAAELVNEYLATCPPQQPRSQGIALRLLAACYEPAHRPVLLHESAELLNACGARLESAYTSRSLAETYRVLGEPGKADEAAAQAWRLARACKADPGDFSPPMDVTTWPSREQTTAAALPKADVHSAEPESLSWAERRVVKLAAEGLTNRMVAHQLHITESTVEQHLTRAYRKLGVRRRSGLPKALQQLAS